MSLNKLLVNERIKLYKKPATWILTSVLMGLVLLTLVLFPLFQSFLSFAGDTRSWKENYKSELQMLESQEDADDKGKGGQAETIRYLLDHDIEPLDWRTDVVFAWKNNVSSLASVQEMLQKQPENTDLKKEAVSLQKAIDEYQTILQTNNWEAYVQLQIAQTKAGTGDRPAESEQEKAVRLDILQLQLDMGILPISQSRQHFDPSFLQSSNGVWKVKSLKALENNKLMLLRGVDDSGNLLPTTARARLEHENAVTLERLRADIPPVDGNSFLGTLSSSANNLSMVGVLLMVLAGGLIASEFGSGTIKLLLITPHKRQKVYWAKAWLLLELAGMLTLLLFVLAFAVSAIFKGFAGIGSEQVLYLFGGVRRMPYLLYVGLQYLLNLLPLLAYGALAFMLSAVTRKSAIAIAGVFILQFGSEILMDILRMVSMYLGGGGVPGVKFLLFAHTNLNVYLPNDAMSSMMGINTSAYMVDGSMTLGFSLAILAIYIGCFLWIGRDSFCRRDIQ